MELTVLKENSDLDWNLTKDEKEEQLLKNKPIVIKSVWKSSKIFEPYSVTYVSSQPTDKFNFVFIILFFQGIAVFLPWNLFISAEPYFRDYNLNAINASEATLDHQKNLLFYFGFAANSSSVIAMVINILLPISPVWSLTRRITLSIAIQVIAIIITIILAILGPTECPQLVFFLLLTLIIILNIANGIYQNCIYGIAAFLPINYSKIVVFGSYFGGIVVSILHLTSIIISKNLRISGIYYFVASIFILLICFDTYYTSSTSRFYRYHKQRSRTSAFSEGNQIHDFITILEILRKTWKQFLKIFCVYLVSYSIFPVIQINIKPLSNSLYFLPDKYFVQITCYLLFNSSSTLGILISNFIKSKHQSSQKLWIFIILRFLFIPFFMFCNLKPELRQYPVLIDNDIIYITANFFLGLSNGLFGCLSVMYASNGVTQKHAFLVGMLSNLFLMSGVMSGFFLSFLLISFMKYKLF